MERQIIRLDGKMNASEIIRDVVLSARYDEIILKDADGRELTFRKTKAASILDALNR